MHLIAVLFIRWLLRTYPWAFALLVACFAVAVIIIMATVPTAEPVYVHVPTTQGER